MGKHALAMHAIPSYGGIGPGSAVSSGGGLER